MGVGSIYRKTISYLCNPLRPTTVDKTLFKDKGFEKKLYIVGVGYRAEIDRQNCLVLNVGYSHPVTFTPPDGVTVIVDPSENIDGLPHIPISVKGIDKQMVGQVAASIRQIKKPEVYKPSKGIRYEGEQVRNKEGKTAV